MNTIITSFNGILIFQVLFIIMQYTMTRRRYYFYYTVYLLVALVYFSYTVNYPEIHLPAGSIQKKFFAELYQWLPIGLCSSYSAFFISFLEVKTNHPKVYGIIRFWQKGILTYIILDALFILLFHRPIPELIYWVASVFVFGIGIWSVWQVMKKPDPVSRYILTGSICVLLFSFIATIVILVGRWQQMATGILPFVISYVGVMLEMAFFMMAFMLKAVLNEREKTKALQQAAQQENRNNRLLLDMYEMRGKISADLHDQVGSTLYSVSLNSQMALNHVQQHKPEEAAGILARITRSTQTMLGEMNDIVWAINPANDNFNKLAERMQQATRQLFRPMNVEPHFDLQFDKRVEQFSMQKRKNLYLVFKEAVTNAARHGVVTEITVSGRMHENRLLLTIIANGITFIPDGRQQGNGIANMYRRAEEMNSILHFLETPGGGTTVQLELPVP